MPPRDSFTPQCRRPRGQNVDATVDDPSGPVPIVPVTMTNPRRASAFQTQELATVREAMRELHRLLDQLDQGELEKVVLTQRNQMRAVLITLERYSELERRAA